MARERSICDDGGAHRVYLPGVRPTLAELGLTLESIEDVPQIGPGLELGNPDGFVILQCVKCPRSFKAFIEW